ncbi:MAG: hypothetical protein HYT75_05820 [Deltaproteobacteria bacterium]|nr:hypothetical protein [Deltaproteobacteria bacterium]MBI2342129.1 hypothetical protein [Deltaproteobacteria bacterium]
MLPIVCKPGEVGPFTLFQKENAISSLDFNNGAFQFREACIEGKIEENGIATKYFTVSGAPPRPKEKDVVWSLKSPFMTDPTFDVRSTAETLQSYISYLSAISVYRGGFDGILLKPHFEVTVGIDFPNAFFQQDDDTLTFGSVSGKCSFADGDVVIHEFGHKLTYSINREMRASLDDVEGGAISEALSDAFPAIWLNDKEIGESLAVCLGIANVPSPETALRDIGNPQRYLFHGEEEHERTTLYAPFLWFTYQEMIQLAVGNVSKARDIMTVISANMAAYIPSSPKKADFLKAFYNSLIAFTKRPDFQTKYNFDVEAFKRIILHQAKLAGLLEASDSEGEKYIFTLYPEITNIAAALAGFEAQKISLQKGYENSVQAFYQQYFSGRPIENRGVRFIFTDNGAQIITFTADTNTMKKDIRLSAEDAWKVVISDDTRTKLRLQLIANLKHGLGSDREIKFLDDLMQKLKDMKMPVSSIVYLAERTNPQYRFDIKDIITIYVDSVTGETTFSNQAFY